MREFQKKLSSTLAHDLRNPLSSAKISTQLIIKKPANEKTTLDYANRISNSLDRIDKMITELLDASRLSSGENPPLEFKNFDLDWLMREIASELNIVYADRITVQSSGICTGNWNEDGIRRVIENLATNAIKYGAENSLVSLSLENDEDTVTIVVHNEGEPISHADQLTLFEDFKRARSVEDKVGWGLGLSVVKSVVDAHGGPIVLESEKDKGTTFKIMLPKDLSSRAGTNSSKKSQA